MVFYFGKTMTFTSSFFFSLVFWLINIFTFFKLFISLFFFKQVDFDFSPETFISLFQIVDTLTQWFLICGSCTTGGTWATSELIWFYNLIRNKL